MDWTYHDEYKSEKKAMEVGKSLIKLKLAKGARVKKHVKKARTYILFIRGTPKK